MRVLKVAIYLEHLKVWFMSNSVKNIMSAW